MNLIDRGDAPTVYCDGIAKIIQIGPKLDFVFYVETLENGQPIKLVNLHMFRPLCSLLQATELVPLVERAGQPRLVM